MEVINDTIPKPTSHPLNPKRPISQPQLSFYKHTLQNSIKPSQKNSLSLVSVLRILLSNVLRLREIINVAFPFFMAFLTLPNTTKYPRTSWQLQVAGRVLEVIYLSLCYLSTFIPIIWGKIKGVKE